MTKPVDRDEVLRELGDAVREARTAKGMSQEELASASALDRTYVGGVERGERNVGFINLVKLARSLRVRLSELLKDFD